jgi:hemolysin activation/secretion protein
MLAGMFGVFGVFLDLHPAPRASLPGRIVARGPAARIPPARRGGSGTGTARTGKNSVDGPYAIAKGAPQPGVVVASVSAVKSCLQRGGVFAAVFAMFIVPAEAQLAPGVLQAVPPGSPLPRVLPPNLPPVALPTVPQPPPLAPNVPNAVVHVASVAVEGVTAYKPGQIEALTQGLVGPAVPLAKIEAARQAILQRYRGDGYVLSTVAASIDAEGRLRFVVTEGRIASVRLSRDIGPAGVQVLRFLQRLTQQVPINEATLERYLLLAQDVPGITLHAVLQPSAEEPGALTLVAEVSRAAVSGLLTTDNNAPSYTGPIESLGVVNFNSFSEYGEQTQVSLYHTWLNSQTFGQASSEVFLGSSGLKLRLYGGDGEAVPTGPLGEENYLGVTTVFGAVLTYPLIRSRQQTLNLVGSFDGEDTDIRTSAGIGADSLRIARVGADYVRSDLWLGDDRSAVNSATIRLSRGLSVLGASSNNSTDLPRPGEQIDFSKVSAEITRTQTLFSPWQDATVSLMGLLTGQYSPDRLPPAEQFYLGGLQYTRGYYSGEVVGDKALAATAELQLNTAIDLSRVGLSESIPTQFYTFYDWGEAWQNDPQSLQIRIASAGGGVRVTATSYIDVDLFALARLNRYPTGTGPNVTALPGAAVFWTVTGRF